MNRLTIEVPVAKSPRAILFTVSLGLISLVGCGAVADPDTHELRGKVEFTGGDVKQLAGGHVEAVLASDQRIAASGEIQADGTFSLGSPYDGRVLEGVREGEYRVRIVLSDEDSGSRRRRGLRLPSRFRRFNTSGLSFEAPNGGPFFEYPRDEVRFRLLS